MSWPLSTRLGTFRQARADPLPCERTTKLLAKSLPPEQQWIIRRAVAPDQLSVAPAQVDQLLWGPVSARPSLVVCYKGTRPIQARGQLRYYLLIKLVHRFAQQTWASLLFARSVRLLGQRELSLWAPRPPDT